MAETPFFVIPLTLPTLATGNERANRLAAHLGEHAYKGMVWQSNGNSNLWVRGDFGSAQDIDFVAVLGANAQSGTTIRIRLGDSQAEVDGTADYDSTALAFIDPTPAVVPASGLYHSHHELPAPVSERWFRIDIGGHTGDFSASMLVIGLKKSPARYYEPQWQTGVRDLATIQFARNGVPGITAGDKLRTIGFRLAWLTEEEAEEMIAPIDDAIGRTSPIYCCFDPAATDWRQRRTFFGFMEENPELTKIGYDRFQREYSLLSLF